jgi:hypothetical protein
MDCCGGDELDGSGNRAGTSVVNAPMPYAFFLVPCSWFLGSSILDPFFPKLPRPSLKSFTVSFTLTSDIFRFLHCPNFNFTGLILLNQTYWYEQPTVC